MSYYQCIDCEYDRIEGRDIWCDKGYEQFREDSWKCPDKKLVRVLE